MVLHDIAWSCMMLHGFAWFCTILHDSGTILRTDSRAGAYALRYIAELHLKPFCFLHLPHHSSACCCSETSHGRSTRSPASRVLSQHRRCGYRDKTSCLPLRPLAAPHYPIIEIPPYLTDLIQAECASLHHLTLRISLRNRTRTSVACDRIDPSDAGRTISDHATMRSQPCRWMTR